MRNRLFIFSLLALLITAAPFFAATTTYNTDTAHSNIGFAVPIMGGLSQVRGKFTDFTVTIVYDDKDVQEWIIKSSGLDWTIVRPGLLTNSDATGIYRVLTAPKDWRFGMISRADVADFLVRQVDDHALIGTTPLLIG